MKSEEKISLRQFTLLLTIYAIGTSVLITPAQLAATAKESAWLASALSFLVGVHLIMLYIYVGRLQPSLNLFQHNEHTFGKWLGKCFSFIIVLYSLIGASTVLWTVGDFIIVQILPETPLAAICILFMSIVIYGAKLGIETIVKTAEIFFPWIIMLLLVIVIFSIPSIEPKQLQPFFAQPIDNIVGASLYELSLSTLPLVLLFVIFPSFLNKDTHGTKAIIAGYLFAASLILGIAILSISVLGYQLTSHYLYPTYVMAERIEFVALLDRLEAVIGISWVLSIFFKLSMYFYVSLIGISQILGVKNYRSITLPVGIIVIGLALIVYPDSSYAGKWNQQTWIPFSITIGFIYPLLLIFGSKIKSFFKS